MTSATAASPGARNMGVDFLRTVCILYIVGYWHLMPYTQASAGFANWFTEGLTYVALATFVFCSGFLLAGQQVSLAPSGLWSFYRRRLLRIYPLYLVTAILFGVVGLASLSQVVDGALLISMFDPPPLPTLWFVTMIMAFYLVAPLLIHFTQRPALAIAIGAAIFLSLVACHLLIRPFDPRIFIYFPVFVLGILYRRVPALPIWVERYQWWIVLAAIVLLRLSRMGNIWSLSGALLSIPLTLASTLALFVFADRMARLFHGPTVAFLAYASFGVYLWHRLIFKAAIAIYFPQSGWAQVVYLVALVLPLIILLSYFVQREYDRLAARWSPERK